MKIRTCWYAALLAALTSLNLSAQTVTVITSFPKELTAAYKTAFEKHTQALRLKS